MNFKNINTAVKRAKYISRKHKWLDYVTPEFMRVRLSMKFPWTHNYPWLMDDEDELADLIILDMWAGAINRWCEKNKVDNAPYCVRTSCRRFLNSLWLDTKELA